MRCAAGILHSCGRRFGALEYTVFLDDFDDYIDYIKTNLTYLKFVRNREEADVHAILTYESTAAWGTEWTMRLIGLGGLEGSVDTLKWKLPPDATTDANRSSILNHLQLGLVRYLTKAGLGHIIEIQPKESKATLPEEDRWRRWVFSIDVSTDFNGEKAWSNNGYMFILSANRTTDEWRGWITMAGTFRYNRYELENRVYHSSRQTYVFTTYIIKSLGNYWAVGLYNRERQSTYSNLDLSATLSPAVELISTHIHNRPAVA